MTTVHIALWRNAEDFDGVTPAATISGTWHAWDLRPDPSRLAGFCLLFGEATGTQRVLGDHTDILSTANRNFVNGLLGVTITPGVTVGEAIVEIFAQGGPGRWNALTTNQPEGRLELHAGSVTLRNSL